MEAKHKPLMNRVELLAEAMRLAGGWLLLGVDPAPVLRTWSEGDEEKEKIALKILVLIAGMDE